MKWVGQRICRLIVCPRRRVQIKIELAWSSRYDAGSTNELFAIITGVVGKLMVRSLLPVLGGYMMVTR